MKKYTVIIKDNTTDTEIFNKETNAMIAGLAADDDASAILLEGTEDELIIAVNVVQNEIDRLFEKE